MAEPDSDGQSFIERLRESVRKREEAARQAAEAAQEAATRPAAEAEEGEAAAEQPPQPPAPPAQALMPNLYTFTGFSDSALVTQPGLAYKTWRLLYLDLPASKWLLVENDGIMFEDTVVEDKAPNGKLDVVWVTADTAVGIGSGSQSLEAQFLTGDFTRAADFRASPAGGTLAASTGVFCDAQSIGCCRPTNR